MGSPRQQPVLQRPGFPDQRVGFVLAALFEHLGAHLRRHDMRRTEGRLDQRCQPAAGVGAALDGGQRGEADEFAGGDAAPGGKGPGRWRQSRPAGCGGRLPASVPATTMAAAAGSRPRAGRFLNRAVPAGSGRRTGRTALRAANPAPGACRVCPASSWPGRAAGDGGPGAGRGRQPGSRRGRGWFRGSGRSRSRPFRGAWSASPHPGRPAGRRDRQQPGAGRICRRPRPSPRPPCAATPPTSAPPAASQPS